MNQRKIHEPTPDDTRRWRAAVEEEEAARPANIARDRRRRAAALEQSIAGQLRRAVASSGLRQTELAERAGIPFQSLADFMAGDAPLDSDAVARLGKVLRFELAPIT